jgi:hypothetical protein
MTVSASHGGDQAGGYRAQAWGELNTKEMMVIGYVVYTNSVFWRGKTHTREKTLFVMVACTNTCSHETKVAWRGVTMEP